MILRPLVTFTYINIAPSPVNHDIECRTQVDLAIECCLMLRQVYHLPLRQTEDFTRSLIKLMELNIRAPDYTSLSKRSISLELKKLIDTIEPGSHFILDSTGLKVYGRDEWHQEKPLRDRERRSRGRVVLRRAAFRLHWEIVRSASTFGR